MDPPMNPYTRTKKMPFRTKRQIRLLDVLRTGSYDDLAETIYEMAEEEFEQQEGERRRRGNDPNEVDVDIPPVENNHMRLLSLDGNPITNQSAPRVVFELLITMHRSVIEALIDGTLAYKHEHDPEFQALLSSQKNDCMGVYLISFLIDDKYWFSSNEIDRLVGMMTRYLDGAGKRASEADVAEAVEIELAWTKRKDLKDDIRKSVEMGERTFGLRETQRHKFDTFCRMLQERKMLDLNPSGDYRPIQTQVQIGSASNIELSMPAHNPYEGLQKSLKLYSLVISCAKVMGLDITSKRVPILRLWNNEHIQLAENLITFLSGSLVQDGGLNIARPGGREEALFEYPEKLEQTAKEVIIRQGHTMQNLEEAGNEVRRRTKTMEILKTLDNLPDLAPTEQAIRELDDGFRRLKEDLRIHKTELEQEIAKKNTVIAALKQNEEDCRGALEFARSLDAWLNSTRPDPVIPDMDPNEWQEMVEEARLLPGEDTDISQEEWDMIRSEADALE